jgi:acetate kinase
MTGVILALNAGSSSLTCSLFATMSEKDVLSLAYRGGAKALAANRTSLHTMPWASG